MRKLYLVLAASIILVLVVLVSILTSFSQGETLTINTTPKGATITLNGTLVKTKTPLTILKPTTGKEIVITASLSGYQSQTLSVPLTSEKNQTISLTFVSVGANNSQPTPTIPPPYRINPSYVEKLKKEPFWAMLPYWGDHYKIEYQDSNDIIIVTTNNGTTTQIQGYQQEALSWLQTNGANLQTLKIQYTTAQ